MKRWVSGRFDRYMNTLKIKKKLFLLYFYCVMLPLVLTDTIILYLLIQNEYNEKQEILKSAVNATEYTINSAMEEAVILSKNIYFNKYINEFLNTKFQSNLEYYNRYQDLLRDSLFDTSLGTSNTKITIYANNEGIVNGGRFWKTESVEQQWWYQHFVQSGLQMRMYFYYDDSKVQEIEPVRKASFVRKLDRYKRDEYEKFLKIDLDYTAINERMTVARYGCDVYVCADDGRILFSNTGKGNMLSPYSYISSIGYKKGEYMKQINIYGQTIQIYAIPYTITFLQILKRHLPFLILLIGVNVVIPWFFVQLLRRNFVDRLDILSKTFVCGTKGELKAVPESEIHGMDEIAALMRNYNIMVQRVNRLIETVYKSKLKEQEMNIARQKAELLALHEQINPHFLFNVLENIRMRSVLKQEYETAEMIEQLSLMQRQYVEWGTDMVAVQEEIKFVEAYLKLQKYRFGDRLSYDIQVEESCREYRIPKLSLVTFVENACVHGVEDKAVRSWVFVKVYQRNQEFHMEIEDTGGGMSQERVCNIYEKMKHANIQMLKGHGRVGIVNACLRLKMQTNQQVRFEIESEKGLGTVILISAPIHYFDMEGNDVKGTYSG